MDPDRLRQMFQAQHVCVRIVTHEEARVLDLALATAAGLGLEPWLWSVTDGVRRVLIESEPPVPDTQNPARGLRWLTQNVGVPSLIVTLDLAEQLSDSVNLRAFRDLVERVGGGHAGVGAAGGAARVTRSRVLMIDHSEQIPPVVGAISARYEILPPADDEIRDIVKGTLRTIHKQGRGGIQINVTSRESDFMDSLVQNLRGLTRTQIRQLVTRVVADDMELSDADIHRLQQGKRELMADTGVLEFVDAPTSMDQIGGLDKLKAWLKEREHGFADKAAEFGLSPPRGVMLLGVQGAGKSLAAKAIATAWKRPLMRLDPGILFDKYIGETERKLRDALRQAEAMAPVVLWIDEIEKGFASSASESTDGGVGRRMFGTLLTWMQEHREPVFVVATANDIEALPPELLRKGRFDEIFFVDLPGDAARREIFAIHLRRRGKDPSGFDVPALAKESAGFSGAEIEQAVLSALYRTYSSGGALTTELVREAARASPPLSVTMRERIDGLRAWARGRCVPAE